MNTKGVNFQPSERGQFSTAVDTSARFAEMVRVWLSVNLNGMASIVGGPSGASVPGHPRTDLERGRILATIWIPGANPLNVLRGARGKSLWLRSLASKDTSPGPRRCHDGGCSVGGGDVFVHRY
jgi:hypothetical protein